jgi:hypothetical protein
MNTGNLPQSPPGAHYNPHPGGHPPQWQRHVMVFLWIVLGAFILVMAALMFAEGRGYLEPHHGAPPSTGPADPS